jgi:hypothetical protein
MSQPIFQSRDGFYVLEGEFAFQADTWNLDPQRKRVVTICNLFVNHKYSIRDLARVLDESRTDVIQVLLRKGIIGDRRMRQARPPEGIEHRNTFVSTNVPLESD